MLLFRSAKTRRQRIRCKSAQTEIAGNEQHDDDETDQPNDSIHGLLLGEDAGSGSHHGVAAHRSIMTIELGVGYVRLQTQLVGLTPAHPWVKRACARGRVCPDRSPVR